MNRKIRNEYKINFYIINPIHNMKRGKCSCDKILLREGSKFTYVSDFVVLYKKNYKLA